MNQASIMSTSAAMFKKLRGRSRAEVLDVDEVPTEGSSKPICSNALYQEAASLRAENSQLDSRVASLEQQISTLLP